MDFRKGHHAWSQCALGLNPSFVVLYDYFINVWDLSLPFCDMGGIKIPVLYRSVVEETAHQPKKRTNRSGLPHVKCSGCIH